MEICLSHVTEPIFYDADAAGKLKSAIVNLKHNLHFSFEILLC